MVAVKKVKKQIKKKTHNQKQRQNQKQLVNVNVKIDQSKKGTSTGSSRPKTIVQRVGPQIIMTAAGSYNFPQRTLESNSNNQYNQLASIMEKIVGNERYKAGKGDALDLVREKRINRFEPNVASNGLASVKTNNDWDMMSTLTRDESVDVFVPEEDEDEDEDEIVVPQTTDPNISIYDDETLVKEEVNPMTIKEKADKYSSLVEEEEKRRYEVIPEEQKVYAYPTNLPSDASDKYFNTQTGRWNLNRNVKKQKGGYRIKELSDAHYKKNV